MAFPGERCPPPYPTSSAGGPLAAAIAELRFARATRHSDGEHDGRSARCCLRMDAGTSQQESVVPAPDDDQERRARLPLLGKRAVAAHDLHRWLAAESDEAEQSPGARRA